MEFNKLIELLRDERSGMYFLAGFDQSSDVRRGIVTVHAAKGVLKPEHCRFIESLASKTDASLEFRIRYHESQDLQAPDCLERFAGLFRHDRILADPTGAFARLLELVAISRSIRSDFDEHVDRILWRSDLSTLVVVPKKQTLEQVGTLEQAIRNFVFSACGRDLKAALKAVRVEMEAGGRFTPVDEQSRPAPAPVRLAKSQPRIASVLARVSGLAALLGFGALTAAHARVPAEPVKIEVAAPGITGLLGLTTLGENSFGLRNQFQAIGGLSLYFAGSGHVLTAALMVGTAIAPLELKQIEPPQTDPVQGEAKQGETEEGDTAQGGRWPLPTRIQYAR